MTAVASTAFTAAQFNTHVRDNLNETAPAKATTSGRLIVTAGPNSIAEQTIPRPTQATDLTVFNNITNETYAAGVTDCGVVFTAPPSGWVAITVSATLASNIDGNYALLSWELRTGSVFGSGTQVSGPHDGRSVGTSRAVNTGAPARLSASFGPYVHFGLTPGNSYNARTMHRLQAGSPGNFDLVFRHILAVPIL